jgi:hypothetical protein
MSKKTKKAATKNDAKEPKGANGEITLQTLSLAYIAAMEKEGKSPGTCASYSMELRVAMAEIGADLPIKDLTPERVGEFFGSDRVNKLKSGRAKSPLSIAKTQRVLRLALILAAERGWIKKAPLPEPKAEPEAQVA